MVSPASPDNSLIGAALSDVPTPALIVDLDSLDHNLRTMAELTGRNGAHVRPHAKTHKCAEIARRQIGAGAVGICCAKLSEAEAMAAEGIADILITIPIVGRGKPERVAQLARRVALTIVVDHPTHVDLLAEAALRADVELSLLIELDVGQNRCGLPPIPERVIELARYIGTRPGLKFRGVQAYHGKLQMLQSHGLREAAVSKFAASLRSVLDALDAAGLAASVITGGGTGSLMVDLGLGILNELQPGSYAYMDYNYVGIEWDAEGGPPPFRVASTVLASVISQSHLGHVVVDAGFKALSSDNGVPRVKGYPEWTFQFAGDEYGQINVPGTDRRPSIGDVLELIPSHCDTTAALHRQCIGVRGGRVNAIWDVIAHGMHD